jgi:hypothetical protein
MGINAIYVWFIMMLSQQNIAKMSILLSPCMSVRLFSYDYSKIAERVFIKSDIGEFYYNLWRHYSFWSQSDNSLGSHPRSSAAVAVSLHMWLITADGRQEVTVTQAGWRSGITPDLYSRGTE